MVIHEAIKKSNAKIGTRDTDLLFRSVLKKSQLELLMHKTDSLTCDEETEINTAINRILDGEPLQYVVGNTEFMSLEFDVNPSVLIPRSDTECLVEEVIKKAPSAPKILDIGTGSGCIAISLAYYIKDADVYAMDISEQALKTAKSNAEKNNVNVTFIHHDIMKPYSGEFDIIVSNPPYIETDVIPELDLNVRAFEPHLALDGGSDGLDFYKRITAVSPSLLKQNGQLFFEVGYNQAASVASLMDKSFKNIRFVKDLCGINRVVCGTLLS